MPTSAHRLHDLLRDVHAQGSTSLPKAWSKVLDAEFGSTEYARRHAASVSLLVDTVADIDALPVKARERALLYVPKWWRAVVGTQQLWGSPGNDNAQMIIDTSDLHHLSATADLIEARLGGTSLAPSESTLTALAVQATAWLTLVQESTDLPAAIAGQLMSQLHHLQWLIEQADRFGTSSVARSADETLGALARASTGIKDPALLPRWQKQFGSLVAAIVMLTTGITVSQQALEASAGALAAVEDNIRGRRRHRRGAGLRR